MGGDYYGNGTRSSVYDPATNRWTARNALGLARDGVATAVLGDKLYVMGGHRFDPIRNLHQFLDKTISVRPGDQPLDPPRLYARALACGMAGTTVLLNGKPRIEVVGGGGGLAADNLQYIP